jgi:hypothetical protein
LEKLLGVPVGVDFDEDVLWKELLSKLSDSVKHRAAQKLSVFGRIHAARSYIGSKAWFLAAMVPPNHKGLKKLSTLLWAYIQNNASIDITNSNAHYSPWSRQLLVQQIPVGGLNAQDPQSFMIAIHAKWIFKLLDPRHIGSWKSLPFHFLRNIVKGLGDSIFLVDPSILTQKIYFSPRWHAYLQAWFASGLAISPPPQDFECILNEPIWFNRFLYIPFDTKRERLRNKNLEEQLVRRGFTHLNHFLSPSRSTRDRLCYSTVDVIQ